MARKPGSRPRGYVVVNPSKAVFPPGAPVGPYPGQGTIGVPVNNVLPVITGTSQEGQTLSVTNGTWSNSPTSFTYQWKRNGAALGGSVNSTRILTSADVGAIMTCSVIASNASGPGLAATSAPTVSVIAAPVAIPTNTVLPAVTGTAAVGQVLTTDNGTWTGTPTGYAYQWRRNGVNITGATSQAYTVVTGDMGTVLTVRVSATNAGGSAPASSAGTVIFTPVPTAKMAGVRADAVNTLASQEAWLGSTFDYAIVFAEQSNAANPWATNLAFTRSEITKWQGTTKPLKWALPICTGAEPIAQTLDGTNDVVINDTLRAISDDAIARNFVPYIRPGWEQNLQTAYPWGATIVSRADYKAAFNKIAAMAKAINPNFIIEFCICWRKDSGYDFTEFYPGPNLVDMITIDMYCLFADRAGLGLTTNIDHSNFMFNAPFGFNKIRDFAIAQNKPFAVDEWGVDHENPEFVNMMADNVRAAYFHAMWDQGSCRLSTNAYPDAGYAYVRNFGTFHIATWALSAAPGAALSGPIVASKPIVKIEVTSADAGVSGLNVTANAQANGTRRITVRATDERGQTASRSIALTWQAGQIYTPPLAFGAALVDWCDPTDALTVRRHLNAVDQVVSKTGSTRIMVATAANLRPSYVIRNGAPALSFSGTNGLVQTDVSNVPPLQSAITYFDQFYTDPAAAAFSVFSQDSSAAGGTNIRGVGYNSNNVRVQANTGTPGPGPILNADRSIVVSFAAGASSAFSASINGGTSATGTVTVDSATITRRTWGSGVSGASLGSYSKGIASERFSVNIVVTAAQRDAGHSYFQWKYGLEADPIFQASASAYKANPPMVA